MGDYRDFSQTNSIKLYKNKICWIEIIGDFTLLPVAFTLRSIVTPGKGNIPITEGTIIFDSEDSDFNYYHINTAQSDNAIRITQN